MQNKENKSDKRTEKRKIGDLGEKIVSEWLERKGFKILEKNYLRKWGEIDLIARKGSQTHFIEVKSVTCENFDDISREKDAYRPEDNIHPWKLKRLSRTIQSYLLEKEAGEGDEWQFDAIAVYLDQKNRKARINFLEDIVI